MKIKFLCESVLTEDIEAVKSRYNVDDDTFNKIVNFDPTYRKGSNSVGKYTKWMLDKFKSLGFPKIETTSNYIVDSETGELYITKENLTKFDDLKSTLPNQDIGQFKTFDDFDSVCNTLSVDNLTDRQKERRLRNSISSKDVKLVLDTPSWTVYTPLTYGGSCTLGKGTEWCTAYSNNDSAYNYYSGKGPLYVIINKSNPSEKYQLHVESHSFMDKSDSEVSFNTFDTLWSDEKLSQFFQKLTNISSDNVSDHPHYQLPETISIHVDVDNLNEDLPSMVYDTVFQGDSYAQPNNELLNKLVQLKLGNDKDKLNRYETDKEFRAMIVYTVRKEWRRLITREVKLLVSRESKKLHITYNDDLLLPFSVNTSDIPNLVGGNVLERQVFEELSGRNFLPYKEKKKIFMEFIQKLFDSPELLSFNQEDYVDDYKKYFCDEN